MASCKHEVIWFHHIPAVLTSHQRLFDSIVSALQVWNHTFFWESMKPNGGGEPTGKLADAIKASFGSFDEFKTQFKNAGEDCLERVGQLFNSVSISGYWYMHCRNLVGLKSENAAQVPYNICNHHKPTRP